MRRSHATSTTQALALAAALVLTFTAPTFAAPKAALGGHDIGELMSMATEHFALSTLDAIVLLDERVVVLADDGTTRRTTHAVVWFGTELGLGTYADLRVP